MIYMNKRDTARRLTVESWMESYGSRLYGLMQVYLGPEQADLFVFEQLVVEVFQNYREVVANRSVSSALLQIALTVYGWVAHNAAVSAGDRAQEESASDTVPLPERGDLPKGDLPELAWPEAVCNIHRLPPDQRDVLCAWLWEESDVRTVEGVLLRPRRWIHERLIHAVQSLYPDLPAPVDALAKTSDMRLAFNATLDTVQIPDESMVRVLQVLWATDERARAEQRHRGPIWMRYGIAGVLVLSAVAIGYGAYRPHEQPDTAQASSQAGGGQGLPQVLSNFPGTIVAQYRLPDSLKQPGLDHVVAGPDGVYVPKLNMTTDNWPFVEVDKCSFADSGQSLTDGLRQVAKIEMIPPVSKPDKRSASYPNWTVQNWEFDVTGAWGVVQVTWKEPGDGPTTKTQLYLVYLPSAKSSLVMTLDSPTREDIHVIGVGDGKIAIQSAVHGNSTKSPIAQPLGLPIRVYSLAGTVPLKAMGEAKQIPAPFGLMVNPVVVGDTLVFQGIQGQAPELDNGNAVWYGLSSDGQVARYAGPPVDGQTHWVVKGTSGNLWWAETTPDPVKPENMQVLLSPLTDVTQAGESPAISLGGKVQLFRTSGQYAAWIQNTDNASQLVVGQVH